MEVTPPFEGFWDSLTLPEGLGRRPPAETRVGGPWAGPCLSAPRLPFCEVGARLTGLSRMVTEATR